MKLNSLVQRGAVLALTMVGMLAAPVLTNAQKKDPIERFTAEVTNVTGTPMQIRIDLFGWSTDAEREKVFSAFSTKGDKELVDMFKEAPKTGPLHGYVWTSEAAGYAVRFAHRQLLPDGTERITVLTDRKLGSWNPYVFKPVGGLVSPADYAFTLLEIRMGPGDAGEGKASILAKVAPDEQAKTLVIENYASAPLVLKNVKRTPRDLAPLPVSN